MFSIPASSGRVQSTAPSPPPLLTPRKLAAQVIGWLMGVGLLAFVIYGAVNVDDASGWQRVRDAPPHLLAILLGSTVVSAVLNGTTFWITIRAVRQPRWRSMQLINVVANMLNYAPVRLGAIARVVYHVRVDRLSLMQVAGWFMLVGFVLVLGVSSCVLATLARTTIDLFWVALVAMFMALGAAAGRWLAGLPMVVSLTRAAGVDAMWADTRGLTWALGLRLLDLAAYAARMYAAAAILGLPVSPSQVVILAMVALASSLVPVGKLGVREFCVAAVASQLHLSGDDLDAAWKQLALVESAGEALVFIPLGGFALLWLQRALRSAPEAAHVDRPPEQEKL